MIDRRITWDRLFMNFAIESAKRSTCIRRQVGAAAVVGKRVVATGYNGAPSGMAHCTDTTCVRTTQAVPSGQRSELCRAVHAEQNLIIQCAMHGMSMAGSTVYTTHKPCITCLKMLINLEVTRILYVEDYPDPLAAEMCDSASAISIVKFDLTDGLV